MDNNEFSMFLAGDAVVTTPWSAVTDPAFLRLVSAMRQADVTILNLETVIRSDCGYPQADSGGIWLTSPPSVAGDLAWAGVDMVSHANNHAFDYGSGGILETHRHIADAGIVLSGSGEDLQHARAPRYVRAQGAMIGHVSMASSHVAYGRASMSRPDMRGRPGTNPLRVDNQKVQVVPARLVRLLRRIDRVRGHSLRKYDQKRFWKLGRLITPGDRFEVLRGGRLEDADRLGNLEAVGHSSSQADVTVVSIHSHDQRDWLRAFIVEVIAAGADIVLVHGVHHMCAIEFIAGKPVFFGLGDFAFQVKQVEAFPSDAYENAGLDADCGPQDIIRQASGRWKRSAYEGCAARLEWKNRKLAGIRLIPLDLQFDGAHDDNGRPIWADTELARKIIADIAQRSSRTNVRITYDETENVGRFAMP